MEGKLTTLAPKYRGINQAMVCPSKVYLFKGNVVDGFKEAFGVHFSTQIFSYFLENVQCVPRVGALVWI